jgi:UDP-4-amino-4,6-dideoxy-N-acetyl-beta-L-altrosamine transaminase
METIPYGTQWLDDDDIAAVVEVLRHGNLTQGPKVQEFEQALATKVGAKFCVVFSNATAALHCAVKALDLEPGRTGVTSPNTFVASANCMAYNGIIPHFADIDPRTYNVTAESLAQAIDPQTAVLIPVHFAGQPCPMDAIGTLARKQNLPVIEDAAHAIGSRYADGSPVGCCAHSAMTVFSFHPVKTMTTGEGGAVTTNSPDLYHKLVLLRSHGITKTPSLLQHNPGPWYYEQQDLGFNYRLSDIQCALGISQLKKLDAFHARRREIVAQYNQALTGLPGLTIPYEAPGLDSCFHLYVLQIDFAALGIPRAHVMKTLADKGIGTQVHYIPVFTQPWYQATYRYESGLCPNAQAYYEKALSLPLFPKMTNENVQQVITGIHELLGQRPSPLSI